MKDETTSRHLINGANKQQNSNFLLICITVRTIIRGGRGRFKKNKIDLLFAKLDILQHGNSCTRQSKIPNMDSNIFFFNKTISRNMGGFQSIERSADQGKHTKNIIVFDGSLRLAFLHISKP